MTANRDWKEIFEGKKAQLQTDLEGEDWNPDWTGPPLASCLLLQEQSPVSDRGLMVLNSDNLERLSPFINGGMPANSYEYWQEDKSQEHFSESSSILSGYFFKSPILRQPEMEPADLSSFLESSVHWRLVQDMNRMELQSLRLPGSDSEDNTDDLEPDELSVNQLNRWQTDGLETQWTGLWLSEDGLEEVLAVLGGRRTMLGHELPPPGENMLDCLIFRLQEAKTKQQSRRKEQKLKKVLNKVFKRLVREFQREHGTTKQKHVSNQTWTEFTRFYFGVKDSNATRIQPRFKKNKNPAQNSSSLFKSYNKCFFKMVADNKEFCGKLLAELALLQQEACAWFRKSCVQFLKEIERYINARWPNDTLRGANEFFIRVTNKDGGPHKVGVKLPWTLAELTDAINLVQRTVTQCCSRQ